ncbi:hypothetical protein [Antribacter gilvus]|uniref:hypothetical protein n=1 Tax=Antribacter gilvus TaxID=2304675 RepID=UPI000F78DF62|nr:hypothetical protein [Antribacter gilvus]
MNVYPRDASWHDRPGRAYALHAPEDLAAPTWAACAPGRTVLSPDIEIPIAEAPAFRLCRRPACVKKYTDGLLVAGTAVVDMVAQPGAP